MGEHTQRRPSWLETGTKNVPWILLTAQSSAFALVTHYSRVMPPAGGKRYLTSTAVVMNEIVKLAISLTMALYDVSKAAPPSMPATSLLYSLTSSVFSGDSWKLAIPAGLGVLSSSLQYVALSNMQAALFQVTFQLQFLFTAIFGVMLLRRSIPLRKWGLLLILLVGLVLVHIPNASSDDMALNDEASSLHFPRSLEEWKAVKGVSGNLLKRSATYEGIEEDMQTADPRLNPAIGLIATICAAMASSFESVYFEKVLRDSSQKSSMWVRNVQLAVYSLFPALFIGVLFPDGETIANNGFFQGYNPIVWSAIVIQAVGGIFGTFSIGVILKDTKCPGTTTSIILSILGSAWLFDFDLTTTFLLGSAVVLVATNYYGNPNFNPSLKTDSRPPPIRVDSHETNDDDNGLKSKEFSIQLPTTPFISDGISSSRPSSPAPGYTRGHIRMNSNRGISYFAKE